MQSCTRLQDYVSIAPQTQWDMPVQNCFLGWKFLAPHGWSERNLRILSYGQTTSWGLFLPRRCSNTSVRILRRCAAWSDLVTVIWCKSKSNPYLPLPILLASPHLQSCKGLCRPTVIPSVNTTVGLQSPPSCIPQASVAESEMGSAMKVGHLWTLYLTNFQFPEFALFRQNYLLPAFHFPLQ